MNNMVDFGIHNTPPNAALAATVHARLQAEASRLRAKSGLWWLSGMGVFVLLLGAGVGLAAFGYSYVTDQRAAGGNLADAMVTALNKAKLEVGGTIQLADGSTVKLDTSGATVRVESGATVRIDGGGGGIRPTEQQLGMAARPSSDVNPVTNYTVFKSVGFEDGEVVTGWQFDSNADQAPSFQFCYYSTKQANNVFTRYTVARDGMMVPEIGSFPFNARSAFTNCVWFNGSAQGRKT